MKTAPFVGFLLAFRLANASAEPPASGPFPGTLKSDTLESCVYALAKAIFSVETQNLTAKRDPSVEYAAVVLSAAMVCVQSRHLDAESKLDDDAKSALFNDTIKRALKDTLEK